MGASGVFSDQLLPRSLVETILVYPLAPLRVATYTYSQQIFKFFLYQKVPSGQLQPPPFQNKSQIHKETWLKPK